MEIVKTLTEILQTGGGYAMAAIFLWLYLQKDKLNREMTTDLVATSKEVGAALERMVGSQDAQKGMSAKLDALLAGQASHEHQLALLRQKAEDGGA